jgi:hypothetical protein
MGLAAVLATATRRLPAQGGVAELPGSTRSVGLGGAGAALVGDAGGLFANPAAIATSRRFGLEGSYEQYLGATTLSSAAAAVRLGRFNWGIGAQALQYPAGPTAPPTAVLGVTSLAFRYGLIAVGTSAKYLRESMAGTLREEWAGDAGIAIAVFDILALGASMQNLGGSIGDGGLTRRARLGFTMNYVDPQGTARFLTTLEGQWPAGQPARLVAGAEAGIVARGVGFVGRVGASGGATPDAASPLAFGAGVELGRLHVDYAHQTFAARSGGTHRFGVRWTP